MRVFYWIAMMALFVLGCSDGEEQTADTNEPEDTSSETDTEQHQAQWTIEQIEDASVGLQARVATSSSGTVAVAYFAHEAYVDGICEEVENAPPERLRYELRYAARLGPNNWATERVDAPVFPFNPKRLDLAFNAQHYPIISYTGGDPQDQYCGGNDAVLAIFNGQSWDRETASAESGDSNTGLPESDSGFVVGISPALAIDANGQLAVLHRDAHFGALQHDDKYRADAEFAWRVGGSWIHEAVDPGEGAGFHNELVFDTQGRPIALYAITVDAQGVNRHGVWAARRESDGTWHRTRIHSGAIFQEISAGINPLTQQLTVAFYSAKDYAVRVRTLIDENRFVDADAWLDEIVGKSQYDEGQYVSLAFTPAGNPALAYHRCKRYDPDNEACDQNDEALIFALKQGGSWQYEVVREADVGSCGEYASLDIDASGTAYIAFNCTVELESGFAFRPFMASKPLGNDQ
ncbi:MAG: hypothetical protein QNJ97_13750 [Myxococcota bacterium]|nr:hypothetical protein [Myxococcota bacterium]